MYPTGPAAALDPHCSIAEQAEWLRQEAPAYLLANPSNLHFIARHCREFGVRVPSLRGLRSVGEVLTDAARETCREVWGLEPVDMYSAVEAGYLALQCPEQGQLHVQAENAMVEVIDADGRAGAPGEVGRVVVTPLHNFAMPLLRYELGDFAEVGAACACGRSLPVLRRTLGRTREQLLLPSGDRRLPYVGHATASFPGIIQHQLVQTSLEVVEVSMMRVASNPAMSSVFSNAAAKASRRMCSRVTLVASTAATIRRAAPQISAVPRLIRPRFLGGKPGQQPPCEHLWHASEYRGN